jgi:alpha-1,2-mannosyltransferase
MALLIRWQRFGRPLVLASLIGLYAVSAVVLSEGGLAFDLHVFWQSARAVGHGASPYDPQGLARMSRIAQANLNVLPKDEGWAVYPPVLYVVMIPLGLLPFAVAAPIGMVLLAATPWLALRAMGVRDWRCQAAAYASLPVVTATVVGTISGVLMLGCALLWRGRNNTAIVGVATIVAKLFLWPLVVVIAALEGFRRAIVITVAAVLTAIASWAIIDFADLRRYPGMLSQLSAAEAHESYSLAGMAHLLGARPELGTDVGVALALVTVAFAFRAGRRGRKDVAFTLAILAALLASPIVWMHYFTLLLLPIAARYPRFNAVWCLPLLSWVGPAWCATDGHWLPFAVTWPWIAVVAIVCVWPTAPTRAAAWLRAAPGRDVRLRTSSARTTQRG